MKSLAREPLKRQRGSKLLKIKSWRLMTDNSTKLVKFLEASFSQNETVVNEKIMQLDQKIDPKF
jgi:hypothetical protein